MFSSISNFAKNTFATIKDYSDPILSYCNITKEAIDQSAAWGGFILSLKIFLGANYDENSEIYTAVFSLLGFAIILATNGYINYGNYENQKAELAKDKTLITTINKDLKKFLQQTKLKEKYDPASSKDILKIFDQKEKVYPLNHPELVNTLKKYVIGEAEVKNNMVKYGTSLIKFLLTLPTSAATVFIYFIVPQFLIPELFENKKVIKQAAIPALFYAIVSALLSAANSKNYWDTLANEKKDINATIDELFNQIKKNPALEKQIQKDIIEFQNANPESTKDSTLLTFFGGWKDRKRNEQIHKVENGVVYRNEEKEEETPQREHAIQIQ